MTAVKILRDIIKDVQSRFIDRDEVVEAIGLSIIAEANMFVQGPPGCAKSSVYGDFLARMPGRKGFFNLTKGSKPEELLGPPDIVALREERKMRFFIEDMLPDLEFVNLEEVWKGNSLTRNAILQVLNEHQFMHGGKVIDCPLKFCGASSNEYPEFNEDGAFFDRFLFRFEVGYLTDHRQRMEMVRLSQQRGRRIARAEPTDLTLAHIDELNQARKEVEIPSEIDETSYYLYANLIDAGVRVGDRRFAESFRGAQANAVLQGRQQVVADDLFVFQHTAWTDPAEKSVAQDAVLRTISPETADLTKLFDELEDGYNDFLRRVREGETEKDSRVAASRKMMAFTEFASVAEPQVKRMEDVVVKMQTTGRDIRKALDLFGRAKARVPEAASIAYDNPTQMAA